MLFENEMAANLLNLHRRHLDESQRSMVGARVKPLFEAEAKERQKQGGRDHGRGQKVPIKRSEPIKGESRVIAGESVNVSGASVQRAQRVLRQGTDELIQAVDKGDIKLGTTAKLDHDTDFQVEALGWVENFRGEEFVDELEQLIIDHGPEVAVDRTLHPDQCDQTQRCYRAAITYLAGVLSIHGASQNGGD